MTLSAIYTITLPKSMTEDSTDTAGKPQVRPPMPGQACREIGKRMNGFFDVASISAARYGLTSGLSYVQEFLGVEARFTDAGFGASCWK